MTSAEFITLLTTFLGESGGAFVALAGVSALAAAIVNALKFFNRLDDGQAPAASLGLNAIFFVLMLILRLFPEVNISAADGVAQEAAALIVGLLAFLGQIKGSQLWHTYVLRGFPIIGKAFGL